jgi:hypothetical protein
MPLLFAMSEGKLIFVTGAVVALLLTAYLIVRLSLFRPESVVVLAGGVSGFLVGFLGPFVDVILQVVIEVTIALIVIALAFTVGRLSKSGTAAFLAGAVLIPLTLVAVGYGVYEARASGWQDLQPLAEGSDHPGVQDVWFFFFAGTPIWGGGAVLSGAFAAWIHSRKVARPQNPSTGNDSVPQL